MDPIDVDRSSIFQPSSRSICLTRFWAANVAA
jgi:hypothetical protein